MITQQLKHGLLLCKKNFSNFVDAWNLVQKRSENLKGDGDTDGQSGYITVDNTDEYHPVIRFDSSKLLSSDSGKDDDNKADNGCFKLVENTVVNNFYMEGGKLRQLPDYTLQSDLSSLSGQILYFQLDSSGISSDNSSDSHFGTCTLSELQSIQEDYSKYIYPLYSFGEDGVEVDFRTAPNVQMWE